MGLLCCCLCNNVWIIFFNFVCIFYEFAPYCVHYRVQDKLEIIINTWVCSGVVPSPAEVSRKEGMDILMNKGDCI